jgi:hypothetical protein
LVQTVAEFVEPCIQGRDLARMRIPALNAGCRNPRSGGRTEKITSTVECFLHNGKPGAGAVGPIGEFVNPQTIAQQFLKLMILIGMYRRQNIIEDSGRAEGRVPAACSLSSQVWL